MTLFDKSLQEIDKSDIELLIQKEVSESDTIEFKKDLPSDQGLDAWHSGGSVGDRAKRKILSEIAAFANSLGGTVLIGVDETEDSPPRASSINAIPRCADLAMRFEQMAGSLIEPQIPSLRFQAVAIEEDGGGVVIARVQRSHLAPHRLKLTKECYTRRGERTEKMTMREIRDLVFTTRDLTEHLELQFKERKSAFHKVFSSVSAEKISSIRVSAVPLDPDRIYFDAQEEFSSHGEELGKAYANFADGSATKAKADLPRGYVTWRPMLRGTVGSNESENFEIHVEIFNNGAVNLTIHISDEESADRIYPSWFVGAVLSPILYADRIRNAVNETGVEYGVEVELKTRGPNCTTLMGWGRDIYAKMNATQFGTDNILFPRYRFGSHIDDVLQHFVRDMWNSTGQADDKKELTWIRGVRP